jgi:hypothetical protein
MNEEPQLPADLAEVYDPIWQDAVLLQAKVGIFRNLFTREDSVRLLNAAAPGFFYIIQINLLHDILLGISRLTDPPESFGKPNLSLKRLASRVDAATHPALASRLQSKLLALDAIAGFARNRRNRLIAHSDLATRLNKHPQPLDAVTLKMIGEAVSAICDVINDVELEFRSNTTLFGVDAFTDAEDLLLSLRDASEHRKHEEARLRAVFDNYEKPQHET